MNKNVLLILAVIVTLLTAWLVISLASNQNGVVVTPPSSQSSQIENSGPTDIMTSVSVAADDLTTVVEVR